MPRHILSGVLLLTIGLSFPAPAESADDKAAALRSAIDACDKGASVPLDPEAQAPVVHFGEFFGKTAAFDKPSIAAMKALAAACKLAVDGAPDQKRLKLQGLRTAYFATLRDFDQGVEAATARKRGYADELRGLAAAGSAEASYLLFELYDASSEPGDAQSATGVTREEALRDLSAAASAGHLDALNSLLYEYRRGPNLRRDPQAALRAAEAIMDMPRQGPEPASAFEGEMREAARLAFGTILATNDGFPPDKQARGFAVLKELFDRKYPGAATPYAAALRYGRGTAADAVAARAALEAALAAGDGTALGPLADMLANGEGGPVDGKRALDLLRAARPDPSDADAKKVLAGLYLDNRFTGPRPRQAIGVLTSAYGDIDAFVRAAGLLIDYPEPFRGREAFLRVLNAAALVGEPGAAIALARLKLSDSADFGDVDGARTLLAKLAAEGDAEAAILYAETQYDNLTNASFRPSRHEGGMTDAEIEALVADQTARRQASAFRLKAELMRAGVIFPQDDEGATKSLVSAAELGDVTAMVLLGDAYDQGQGTPKDPRERLRWWREAAKRGSLAAREKIASAFTFDFFDRLITLREGITERIALYNNSGGGAGLMGGAMATMDIEGAFGGGGRAGDAGNAALAAAVLDGFRLAPAGLSEDKLVPLAHALPDELRAAIEAVLKRDGFLDGEPNGYFGPEVRKALAAWVDAKGPLSDQADAAAAVAGPPAGGLPADVVDRLRARALKAANAATNDRERSDAIALINLLAREGDVAARWAMVSNYDKASLVRDKVTAEEVTRYGLDLLVTRPKGAEKIETDFIFTLTALAQAGKSGAFGDALIDAVRDDPRLQDPLTLGSVMQQLIFAPDACDAIAAAAAKASIPDAGDDGCAEAARTALIAYAKAKGPAGVESAARDAAAAELRKVDAAAAP